MCSMRSAERELKRSCGISDDVVVVFVEEEEEYGQCQLKLDRRRKKKKQEWRENQRFFHEKKESVPKVEEEGHMDCLHTLAQLLT